MSGDTLYRRTQIAWPVVVPVASVSLLLAWIIVRTEFAVGLGIALAVLLLAVLLVSLLLFATLTVTVTNDGLLAAFGVGLVRNRDVPPFVVIRTGNTFVVVNFKEPQRTRDLYADLTARINRGHG